MGKIFVSYRRDDSRDVSGRIFDRLIAHFGRPAVFYDVDNIPPGVDFRAHITDAIGQSTVLLAIIGPAWCDCVNADGVRRLDDPGDFVRIEIELALEKNVNVIPILVRDATVPRPQQLPESLRKLVYLNAPEVRSGHDFHSHVDRLIRKLEENFGIERQVAHTLTTAGKDSGAPAPAVKGHCPQCGRNNPSERQFCGGCGEPLREPCFECEFVNEAIDVFCGDCGVDLATNRRARLDKATSDRERVEQLLQESGHFEAIQILKDLQQAKHLRLKSFASWAGETLRVVQGEFDQWCQGAYARAKQMCANKDFAGAAQLLEQIPASARHIDATNLLSSAKDAAAQLLKERVAEAEERRRLHLKLDDMRVKIIKTEPQNLERRIVLLEHFGGLAADAVRRFGAEEFQLFVDWENLESKKKRDELHRQEQARAARLEHLNSADSCLKQYAFTEALDSLILIPESERTPDDTSLIIRVRHTITQLAEATQRIEKAIHDRDYSQLPDLVGQYKAVRPLSKALLQKLAPWRTSVFDEASEQFNCHRYAEAIAQIDRMPESIRTAEMATLLIQAQQSVEEIRKLKASIAEARQQNDLRRLIPDLHRYLELRPEYRQGREFLDKLLTDCLSESKQRFENGDYQGCIRQVSKIPQAFRGTEMAKLIVDANSRSAFLTGCESELARAMASDDTEQWISAWMRAREASPPNQFCETAIRSFVKRRDAVSSKPLRPNPKELDLSDAAINELKEIIPHIHTRSFGIAMAKMRTMAQRNPELQLSVGFLRFLQHVEQFYVGPVWQLRIPSNPLCIAYAAEADQIAIGCKDGKILVLDPTTLLTKELSLEKGPIKCLAISPDGSRFLAACERSWDDRPLWLVDSSGNATQLKGHNKIKCVAFSPNGRLAASGGDREHAMIFVWDVATRKVLHKLSMVSFFSRDKIINEVTSVAFSRDETTLFSSGEWGCDGIRAWDVKTGRERVRFPIPKYGSHNLTKLAVSSNASLVAVIGDQKKLAVWSIEQREVISTICSNAKHVLFCSDDTHVLWSTADDATTRHLILTRISDQKQLWTQELVASPPTTILENGSETDGEFLASAPDDLIEEEAVPSDSDIMFDGEPSSLPSALEFRIAGRDELAGLTDKSEIMEMVLLRDQRRVALLHGSSVVLWSIPDPSQPETLRTYVFPGSEPSSESRKSESPATSNTGSMREKAESPAAVHGKSTAGDPPKTSNLVPQNAAEDEFQLQPEPVEAPLVEAPSTTPPRRDQLVAKIRSGEIGEEVRQLLRQRLKLPMVNVFVKPELPTLPLSNSRKSCCVPESEKIIALIDCTRVGSAKDSLLFGETGIYYHNSVSSHRPGHGFVPYVDFSGRRFFNTGTNVYLDGENMLDMARCALSPRVLTEILDAIGEIIESHDGTGDSGLFLKR